jgi:hypothetical protein
MGYLLLNCLGCAGYTLRAIMVRADSPATPDVPAWHILGWDYCLDGFLDFTLFGLPSQHFVSIWFDFGFFYRT